MTLKKRFLAYTFSNEEYFSIINLFKNILKEKDCIMKKLFSLFVLVAMVGFISCDSVGPENQNSDTVNNPDPNKSKFDIFKDIKPDGNGEKIVDVATDENVDVNVGEKVDVDADKSVDVGVGDIVEVSTDKKVNVDVSEAVDVDVQKSVDVNVDAEAAINAALELAEKIELKKKLESGKKFISEKLSKIKNRKRLFGCNSCEDEDSSDVDVPGM
jgi:hypothetical protein